MDPLASSSNDSNRRSQALDAAAVQGAVATGDNAPIKKVAIGQQPIEPKKSSESYTIPVISGHGDVGNRNQDKLEQILGAFQSQVNMQQQQLTMLQALIRTPVAQSLQNPEEKEATVSKEGESIKEKSKVIELEFNDREEGRKIHEEIKESQVLPPTPEDWAKLHDNSARWQLRRFTNRVTSHEGTFRAHCDARKLWQPSVEGAPRPFRAPTQKGIELSLPMNAERMLSIHWYKYNEPGNMEWCTSVCPFIN